jgi:hypothetical protein
MPTILRNTITEEVILDGLLIFMLNSHYLEEQGQNASGLIILESLIAQELALVKSWLKNYSSSGVMLPLLRHIDMDAFLMQ